MIPFDVSDALFAENLAVLHTWAVTLARALTGLVAAAGLISRLRGRVAL